MKVHPEVLFHRYFQEDKFPRDLRSVYRGKQNLAALEEPFQGLLVAIQASINEALSNERLDIPEHVAHPPFHMDYIESDSKNAIAFVYKEYSFVGVTIPQIVRMLDVAWRVAQSATVRKMLDLQLDTIEAQRDFQVLLFRLQLYFITSHEYTHIVHGHTPGSTLDSPFANEIDSGSETGSLNSQILELDADAYGAFHVLAHLFGESRELALSLLQMQNRAREEQDEILLACFVLAIGSFLFGLPPMTLTDQNVYSLCHPPHPVRMDFITRRAVIWCRQNKPVLAEWMNAEKFVAIMRLVAACGLNDSRGNRAWDEQAAFLRTDIGKEYMRTLSQGLDEYIQQL